MSFPDAYWQRINQVASNIGARQAEDLILVMTAETAGSLDPRRTRYSRRPMTRPKSWKDVIAWESDHPGESSGALGLNTIMRPAAQSMGLSAPEWWDIADLGPGDPKALDYTEMFFNTIRTWRGLNRPFVDAVELYLANAAPGLLGGTLTPNTLVYSGAAAAQNPGLQGPDGNVRVAQMQKALAGIASNTPQQGISAKPFLEEYWSYVKRTGDVYRGPRIRAEEAPIYRPAGYDGGGGKGDYTPFEPDSLESINQANQTSPPHPNEAFARQMVAAKDIPVGKDSLAAVAILSVLAWGLVRLGKSW